MKIDNVEVAVKKWWIDDVLAKRTNAPFNVPLDKLFLVIYGTEEGDTFIDTKLGQLRVFFTKSIPEGKTYILDSRKYNYPRKNNPMEGLPKGFSSGGELIN